MNAYLSTGGTVDEIKSKDELSHSTDMEVDSDTSSSYTDDEGSESSPSGQSNANGMGTGVWSKEEHAKFLEAIKIYTNGPWKLVAAYVGTRTVRQTMTHAQSTGKGCAPTARPAHQAGAHAHALRPPRERGVLMQERLRALGPPTTATTPITTSRASPFATRSRPWSSP